MLTLVINNIANKHVVMNYVCMYLCEPFQSFLCTSLFKSDAAEHLICCSRLLTWVTIQHYFSFCHCPLKRHGVFKTSITDQQTAQLILSELSVRKRYIFIYFILLIDWFILSFFVIYKKIVYDFICENRVNENAFVCRNDLRSLLWVRTCRSFERTFKSL